MADDKPLNLYMITAPNALLKTDCAPIKTMFIYATSAYQAKKYHPLGANYQIVNLNRTLIWANPDNNNEPLCKDKIETWVEPDMFVKLHARNLHHPKILHLSLTLNKPRDASEIEYTKSAEETPHQGLIIATAARNI